MPNIYQTHLTCVLLGQVVLVQATCSLVMKQAVRHTFITCWGALRPLASYATAVPIINSTRPSKLNLSRSLTTGWVCWGLIKKCNVLKLLFNTSLLVVYIIMKWIIKNEKYVTWRFGSIHWLLIVLRQIWMRACSWLYLRGRVYVDEMCLVKSSMCHQREVCGFSVIYIYTDEI